MNAESNRQPCGGEDLASLIVRRVGSRTRRYVGLSVGLSVGGRQAVVGFGRVGPGDQIPNGRTSFQIGSVTKLFTALLFADAVDRGEAAIAQPLDSLIPETATAAGGQPITLVDLATHLSGLPRMPPRLGRQALRQRHDPYASFTSDQMVGALSRPPRHTTGERFRYSNFGGGVLGEALTRASGLSYGEMVQTRIAVPLGLRDTRIAPDGSEDSVAVGHSRRGKPTGDWHMASLAGAGALRSSTEDLLVFLRAHLEPESTSLAGAVRRVLAPRLRVGRPIRIGLAWHILDRKGGGSWWWHNGGTGGFASFVGFDPVARTAVAVLANTARPVDRIGRLLLEPR